MDVYTSSPASSSQMLEGVNQAITKLGIVSYTSARTLQIHAYYIDLLPTIEVDISNCKNEVSLLNTTKAGSFSCISELEKRQEILHKKKEVLAKEFEVFFFLSFSSFFHTHVSYLCRENQRSPWQAGMKGAKVI